MRPPPPTREQPLEALPAQPPTEATLWIGSSTLVGLAVPCAAHTLAQYIKLLVLTQYHGSRWMVTGTPLVLLLFTGHWQLRHLHRECPAPCWWPAGAAK
jgi:hypothetical protein